MALGETLAVVNFAGVVIVGFMSWITIKSAKQQLMELMSRDLAEVRRQMRNTVDRANRQDDQIADNHEKILMIEVNLASMQNELEAMSRKLESLMPPDTADGEEIAESEIVPPSERRHLLD